MLQTKLANMGMIRSISNYAAVPNRDAGSPFRLVYIAEGEANIRDPETYKGAMEYIKTFANEDQMLCLILTGAQKGLYNDFSNEVYYRHGTDINSFLAKIVGSVVKKGPQGPLSAAPSSRLIGCESDLQ